MGLTTSRNLLSLNLKGNGIRDEGLHLLSRVKSNFYFTGNNVRLYRFYY